MAADSILERREGDIAVLTLPTFLTHQSCLSLNTTLARILTDPVVLGVVLACRADRVSSGFDLEDTDLIQAADALGQVNRAVTEARKPIIAALSGSVLNECIDLVLCADGRIAHTDTTAAMTVVDMGFLPGGGATQRLPHLIGPDASLDFMLGGETWSIADKRLDGFVDKIVSEDVEAAAIALARTSGPKPVKRGAPAAFDRALRAARSRHPKATKAQSDLITCVEAALLLPDAQGLAFEHVRFVELCEDQKSRLLRHAAMTCQKAQQDVVQVAPRARPVNRVVAMGRSSDTADLAAMALEQGRDVWIEAGSRHMGEAMAELTLKRLGPETRACDAMKARLCLDETGADMERADLVLDTAELTPDPPVALKPGAVWVVTSPDIAALDRAEEVDATGKTVRMRRLIRDSDLVELSAPPDTSGEVLATVQSALSQGRQSVIVSADVPGGIVGGLFCALARAALVMLVAGKKPNDIEQAARDLGLRQGPMQMIDAIGAGRSMSQMRRVYEHRGVSLDPLRILSDRWAAVSEGDATRARRALVFHAPAGQSAVPDLDLAAWLSGWRIAHPGLAIDWPDVTLSDAFLAALVSEAARLLQSGTAKRASDIDLAAEKGLLMEARSGGPLIQADLKGLLGISRALRLLEPVDAAVWAREEMIDEMVKNGRSFF